MSATPSPPPPAPDGSVPHRTSTASSRWLFSHPNLNCQLPSTATSQVQCSHPNLNCQLLTAVSHPDLNPQRQALVFPPGPQLQAPEDSGPTHTSTASSRWQRSPPDVNRKLPMAVLPTGPQLSEFMSDRVPEYMSDLNFRIHVRSKEVSMYVRWNVRMYVI